MKKNLHNTFGGILYPSDFNTGRKEAGKRSGSSVAARIIADRHFDSECQKNAERRQQKLEENSASCKE